MSQDERALTIRVEGRVQNVGYRAFVQQEASERGIRGWVVNRPDGSVEAAIRGSGAALGDLIGRMRKGPPDARVETVEANSTDRGRVAEVPDEAYTF